MGSGNYMWYHYPYYAIINLICKIILRSFIIQDEAIE